jgi:hypothetical protein
LLKFKKNQSYIPLLVRYEDVELARYNANDTWTVNWNEIEKLALSTSSDFDVKAAIGMAKIFMAARDNFYETDIVTAQKIADTEAARDNVYDDTGLLDYLPF